MSYTRRDFLRSVPLAGGAVALLPALGVVEFAATRSVAAPVLSFHLDQPWVDASGMAEAYHPPAGARGAEPLALLDEQTLSRYYGLI
jgi:hypothetical protein